MQTMLLLIYNHSRQMYWHQGMSLIMTTHIIQKYTLEHVHILKVDWYITRHIEYWFLAYMHFDCLQPVARPGSTRCRTPDFSHNISYSVNYWRWKILTNYPLGFNWQVKFWQLHAWTHHFNESFINFRGVKFWRIAYNSLNSSKFSTVDNLHCMVYNCIGFINTLLC